MTLWLLLLLPLFLLLRLLNGVVELLAPSPCPKTDSDWSLALVFAIGGSHFLFQSRGWW